LTLGPRRDKTDDSRMDPTLRNGLSLRLCSSSLTLWQKSDQLVFVSVKFSIAILTFAGEEDRSLP